MPIFTLAANGKLILLNMNLVFDYI
jgi:hypothetical protein